MSDSAAPDSAAPDSAATDSDDPDSATPDSAATDSDDPDSAASDGAAPDSVIPDATTSPDLYNHPDFCIPFVGDAERITWELTVSNAGCAEANGVFLLEHVQTWAATPTYMYNAAGYYQFPGTEQIPGWAFVNSVAVANCPVGGYTCRIQYYNASESRVSIPYDCATDSFWLSGDPQKGAGGYGGVYAAGGGVCDMTQADFALRQVLPGSPDAGADDAAQPDTTQPDTTQPDTTQPDTTQPDADAQDAAPDDAAGSAIDLWAGLSPFSQVHANAVRLDDATVVVAYTATSSRSTQPDEYHVRVVRFDGTDAQVGPEHTFAEPLLPATTGGALPFMGALGADAFLLTTISPTWERILHAFRRTGDSVTLLESLPFNKAYPGGHPVDEGRYLLRYRDGTSSADLVTYRIVRLVDDAIVMGPTLRQPSPSVFPGLSTSEPQTFSPLLRVGPAVFRELRAGYVYAPGTLAAWTLTVHPDHSLSASAPQVFSTSQEKTMEPLVSANGSGDAVVIYRAYNTGWYYGYLSAGATSYQEKGALNDNGGFNSEQARESTDGYLDGRYYIRSQDGTLYRFDGLGADATVVDTDLSVLFCRNAPSVLRLGSVGAFLTCDGSSELGIRFLGL